jgi:hypothetical protein
MAESSSKCPLCGSYGDDLIFKFYCSNVNCKNYKPKKECDDDCGGDDCCGGCHDCKGNISVMTPNGAIPAVVDKGLEPGRYYVFNSGNFRKASEDAFWYTGRVKMVIP